MPCLPLSFPKFELAQRDGFLSHPMSCAAQSRYVRLCSSLSSAALERRKKQLEHDGRCLTPQPSSCAPLTTVEGEAERPAGNPVSFVIAPGRSRVSKGEVRGSFSMMCWVTYPLQQNRVSRPDEWETAGISYGDVLQAVVASCLQVTCSARFELIRPATCYSSFGI